MGTQDWQFEYTVFLGSDMREPNFYVQNSSLYFSFFQAGTNPLAFQPHKLFRMKRQGAGKWAEPEQMGHEGEIIWQVQTQATSGVTFAASYSGNHYDPGHSNVYDK